LKDNIRYGVEIGGGMKTIMGTALEPMAVLDLPEMSWRPDDYNRYMAALKADGLDMVVLQFAVFEQWACYPSLLRKAYFEYDFILMLFNLAEQYGVRIVLGLALDSHVGYLRNPAVGWDADFDLQLCQQVARELWQRYGSHPKLWGWYIPHETGDRKHRGDTLYLMSRLAPWLKELTPNKKVTHGPWFTSYLTVGADATTPAQYADEWDAILNQVKGIDIYAIQDGTAPDAEVGAWFAAAQPVFLTHGAELWSVVEAFPRDPISCMALTDRAVTIEVLLNRMRQADPYVSGFVTFEYQRYLGPLSHLAGSRDLNSAYRQWLDTSDRR
jgi:hypothetical protein